MTHAFQFSSGLYFPVPGNRWTFITLELQISKQGKPRTFGILGSFSSQFYYSWRVRVCRWFFYCSTAKAGHLCVKGHACWNKAERGRSVKINRLSRFWDKMCRLSAGGYFKPLRTTRGKAKTDFVSVPSPHRYVMTFQSVLLWGEDIFFLFVFLASNVNKNFDYRYLHFRLRDICMACWRLNLRCHHWHQQPLLWTRCNGSIFAPRCW